MRDYVYLQSDRRRIAGNISLPDVKPHVEISAEGHFYKIAIPDKDTDYLQKKLATELVPYEFEMLKDMSRRLAKGDLVIDAGANIGNHTLYLAAITGCKVAAFEPNSHLCDALISSLKINGVDDQVRVYAIALGLERGEGHFEKEIPDNLGAQRIVAGSGKIQIEQLDNFNFPQRVKAIKIDVEGMELDVLKGGQDLLLKDRPDLYIECHTQADFKAVNSWLSDINYGYWDTFNATPTHLFIPNENTSLDERIERLQSKIAEAEYESVIQMADLRQMLNNANLKYRAANEQIVVLKACIAEEEAARKKAEELAGLTSSQLQDVQRQSERARIEVQEHQAELREENLRLEKQGLEYKDGVHEAEKHIVRLETELQYVRANLLDVNQKYDNANALINSLTQGIAHEKAKREIAEAKVSHAESQLARAQQQIETTQKQLYKEHSDFEEKIRGLDEVARNDSARAHEAEKRIIRLEMELEASRSSFEDISLQYRKADERANGLNECIAREEATRRAAELLNSSLKHEVSHEKAVREIAEAKVSHTEAQLDRAKQQIEETQAKICGERKVFQQAIERLGEQDLAYSAAEQATVKRISDQEKKNVSMRTILLDVNQKYRNATEQINEYKQRIAKEEAQLKQARNRLHQANMKYRWAVVDEIPKLKQKLEAQYATTRALQQQKSEELQAQAVKARNTLSYQLGHMLIDGFKSIRGFVGLPAAYWQLRKKATIRRREQNEDPEIALTVDPTSVAAMACGNGESCLSDRVAPIAAPRDAQRLRMACIMDEFSYESFRYECDTLQLTPGNWEEEIKSFNPELLFIESAWRGKDELWHNKVCHCSQEFEGIIKWCRSMKVPTIFWNKEDPVHFETFLTTARQFDYVFTTDIDCIHRYKAALKHDRVYLLPFACQPKCANPIETYERKDAFCFAGAYYKRYSERAQNLGDFIEELSAFRPVEIYDRNYGKNDPNYQFPPEYQPYIMGTLPFEQIDKAYKGYRYAINLNSIKHSQSMFARRVFELLASNTLTVSNFSRGVRLLFGDLVISTDCGNEALKRLQSMAQNGSYMRKLRLAALRKVMQEHTYGRRLAYVTAKVSGQAQQDILPNIAVLAFASTRYALESILASCKCQTYTKSMFYIIIAEGLTYDTETDNPRIQFVTYEQAAGLTLSKLVRNTDLLAGMLSLDYYGPNYLLDIALATQYSDADVIGKGAHYEVVDSAASLEDGDKTYRPAESLAARCSAIRPERMADISLSEWLYYLDTLEFRTDNMLAIDEFNYCRNGAKNMRRELISDVVDDLQGLDTGISIGELLSRAETIGPEVISNDENSIITGRDLAASFKKTHSFAIKLEENDNYCRVISSLPDGKHEYIYDTKKYSLEALGVKDQFRFYLDITPGLNIQLMIIFRDAREERIGHIVKYSNRNTEVAIPSATASISFALRFYASGSAEIKRLILGHRTLQPAGIIGRAEHLILTSQYPSYNALYRNAFVHSRETAYREHGARCDVFKLRMKEPVSFSEFEDVDVITGSQDVLDQMLENGQYKSVLVHFLDTDMWDVLQKHIDRIKVVVWVHGSEIQPWYRRDFDFQTEDARKNTQMKSDKKIAFWRRLLKSVPPNLKLVFVSRYFAEEVMQDIGFRISEDHYTVIHNPINTDLFTYVEKAAEQRKKVLSIRPYSSAKYANDLSVKAIQLLSTKPWFNEMEFRIIGDGLLFEKTLEPLRGFRNVFIEKRFLKQHEIAGLHKEYGIFLCPTRMDAQGVSRDEAMSSGLVTVTNRVAAIPEFVDESCGMLAAAEDYEGLSAGIEFLYENELAFERISHNAAARVRRQSSKNEIVGREMSLFSGQQNLQAKSVG